jgi:hypothetical protein
MDPYLRTLYICNTIGLVGGTVYGLYYGVFLYRHTFSLSVLALDGLMGGIGTYLGYILGVMAVRRFGYSWCIRVAFALWAIICGGTALISGHIAAWFMLIAVLKAIPGGLYAANADVIMLREVKVGARSGFFRLNLAVEFIATIILPTLVGAMVHFTGGYNYAFLAAAAMYACGLLVRTKLPRPTLSFNLSESLSLFRRPLYRTHALNRTVANGMNQLNAFAITIIPFLILQNEFSMGLLTSLGALAAAVIAFAANKIKRKHQEDVAYGAHGLRTAAAIVFAHGWSAPLMGAWQTVGKLMTPLHDPVQQGLDIQNDSLILGKDARRHALQINLVNNTLALIGTTVAFSLFLLLLQASHEQQRTILQSLLVMYAGWRLLNFGISAAINRWALAGDYYVPIWVRALFRLTIWQSRLRASFYRRSFAFSAGE